MQIGRMMTDTQLRHVHLMTLCAMLLALAALTGCKQPGDVDICELLADLALGGLAAWLF